jgi:hypothetical protein
MGFQLCGPAPSLTRPARLMAFETRSLWASRDTTQLLCGLAEPKVPRALEPSVATLRPRSCFRYLISCRPSRIYQHLLFIFERATCCREPPVL